MKRNYFLCSLFCIYLFVACQVNAADGSVDSYTGVVVETMDASGYTYVQIDTGSEKVWAAGPAAAINAGDTVTISTEMPMFNYHSKSLDRDFDVLYFIGSYSQEDTGSEADVLMAHANTGEQTDTKLDVEIKKAEGGKSIAEIIDTHEQLADQNVKVRGKVVKYNQNILGKDWIHIRDSSGEGDLTITTSDKVALGDVILADGKIVLNKDFGFGYVYEILMEDAKVTVE